MSKQVCKYKGRQTEYLRCGLFAKSRQLELCTRHSVRIDQLSSIVAQKAREHIRSYYEANPEELTGRANAFQERRKNLGAAVRSIRVQIDRQTRVLKELFFQKSDGLLGEALFAEMSRGCIEERNALEKQLTSLERRLETLDNPPEGGKGEMELLRKWLDFEELNRELVCGLIDFVEIGERDAKSGGQEIKIHWNF